MKNVEPAKEVPPASTVFAEFNEKEKRGYAIRVEEMLDELTAKKIRLVCTYKPLHPHADNYVARELEIEWDGGDWIEVIERERADSWGGTYSKVIVKQEISVDLPEVPWFFNLETLREEAERLGIKKTIELIVKNLNELFTIDWGESA
jgi:hypothetical protein